MEKYNKYSESLYIGNKKEHTGIYFQNINNARFDNISLYNFNGTGLLFLLIKIKKTR